MSVYEVTVMGVTSPGKAIDGLSVIELPVPRSLIARLMNAVRILKTGVFGGVKVIYFHVNEIKHFQRILRESLSKKMRTIKLLLIWSTTPIVKKLSFIVIQKPWKDVQMLYCKNPLIALKMNYKK